MADLYPTFVYVGSSVKLDRSPAAVEEKKRPRPQGPMKKGNSVRHMAEEALREKGGDPQDEVFF